MIHNDISIRPSKRLVLVGDETVFEYHHQSKSSSAHSINYVAAHILHVSSKTTIWPGEFIEVNTPPGLPGDTEMALEPRCDTNKLSCDWPPLSIVSSTDGKICIPNLTTSPIVLKKDDHYGQLSEVFVPETVSISTTKYVKSVPRASRATNHSTNISLDPDNILPNDIRHEFELLHANYDSVFDPSVSGYNGKAGNFKTIVNMGPV